MDERDRCGPRVVIGRPVVQGIYVFNTRHNRPTRPFSRENHCSSRLLCRCKNGCGPRLNATRTSARHRPVAGWTECCVRCARMMDLLPERRFANTRSATISRIVVQALRFHLCDCIRRSNGQSYKNTTGLLVGFVDRCLLFFPEMFHFVHRYIIVLAYAMSISGAIPRKIHL